ncbi:hypothetical protein O181_049513 [Austropuccinia psidii MF-1]|uniref:Uncharacterized protein n=1 Tax=Austropuccinia psidii MF-1 TaxID=1389203 RepID=A0A9Q3HLH5_9BASI|nr:hypothetical protein [Austropuccinia psidii MF-1]
MEFIQSTNHSSKSIESLTQSLDPLNIIKTVTSSIFEVFLICLVGYILSRKGIIDSKSKSTLNKINISFFTPALMFNKVAFSLTYEKLTQLYIVPITFFIITIISAIIACLLAKLFKLPKPEQNFCISFSMFMNSNSLPIALMTSLISTLHQNLNWGHDDSKDKQIGRSLSYLVIFSTLGMILRYSYGVKLLTESVGSQSDEPSIDQINLNQNSCPEERIGLLNSPQSKKSDLESASDDGHSFSNSSNHSHQDFKSQHHLTISNKIIQSNINSSSPSSNSNSLNPIQSNPSLTSDSVDQSKSLKNPSSIHHQHQNQSLNPSKHSLHRPSSNSLTQSNSISSTSHHHLDPHQGPSNFGRRIFHSFPNLGSEYCVQSNTTNTTTTTDSSCNSITSQIENSPLDQQLDHSPSLNKLTFIQQFKKIIKSFMAMTWIKKTRKFIKKTLIKPLKQIHQFMTPPLYASLLSLIVVALPSLQNRLEEIRPLRSALRSAGSVSVPLTLVVLGAYFNTSKSSKSTQDDPQIHLNQSIIPSQKSDRYLQKKLRQERLTITVSIISRMILTPILLLPLLFVITSYFHDRTHNSGSFHEDPCFILVTVLLIGAPPAITLAQMTSSNPFPLDTKAYYKQAAQNSRFERLVSKTLFISYAILTPLTTIALVVAGLLVEANR